MVYGQDHAIAVKRDRVQETGAGAEQRTLDARVLLAEDGPDNQRLINKLLIKAGAEVTCAADGREALELCRQSMAEGKPFDVILMDMEMPRMDGYTATSLLRAEGYNRPILALTAHAMAGDREKCVQAGCDDYVSKPVDRLKLVEVIMSWLGRYSDLAAAPAEV
jgi:CheY-like chemotaxis protein